VNTDGLTTGALVLLLIREIIGFIVNKKRDADAVQRAADMSQTRALQDCTIAITELKIEFKNFKEVISIIPKMKQDLDVAHERIRYITKEGN